MVVGDDGGMATFKPGDRVRRRDVSCTLWKPGDLIEYDGYGSRFRGRLVKKDDDGSNCWSGVVTDLYAVADNIELPIAVGDTVSLVEYGDTSTKIAHAARRTSSWLGWTRHWTSNRRSLS